jgi:Fur family ferric uptake transcriptional regulator
MEQLPISQSHSPNESLVFPVKSAPQAAIEYSGQFEQGLKEIVRRLGLKVTQQRLTILRGLHLGHSHVTAQQLYEIVCKENPEIGFATVYRFLRTLAEQGFVTEVRMGGMPARYEWADKQHHDHLTCTRCGAIYEFENDTIERLQEQIATSFGFELTSHVLELYGHCRGCQKPSNAAL